MQKRHLIFFFCLTWKGCKADKLVLNALDEVELSTDLCCLRHSPKWFLFVCFLVYQDILIGHSIIQTFFSPLLEPWDSKNKIWQHLEISLGSFLCSRVVLVAMADFYFTKIHVAFKKLHVKKKKKSFTIEDSTQLYKNNTHIQLSRFLWFFPF